MRTAYCIVSVSPVRSEKRDASEMVTQLMFGEIVTVEEIEGPWCRIHTFSDNYPGYCDIKHLHFLSQKEVNRWLDGLGYQKALLLELSTPWGKQMTYRGSFLPFGCPDSFNIGNDNFSVLTDGDRELPSNPFDLAMEYLNTPYLWGGKTPFGIDCSGLTQTVFRFLDINLPRDASQQVEFGMTVDFNDMECGDVAFFSNKEGKVIHVGIVDGRGSIVHASGQVRRDPLTSEGIIHSDTGVQTHHLCCIKRM